MRIYAFVLAKPTLAKKVASWGRAERKGTAERISV